VFERGATLKGEDNTNHRPDSGSGSSGRSGLLARIRNRTESEQSASSSAGDLTRSTAGLGQAPYVAMGGGVIVVQRSCHHGWNC
jgi:hypothetical protein